MLRRMNEPTEVVIAGVGASTRRPDEEPRGDALGLMAEAARRALGATGSGPASGAVAGLVDQVIVAQGSWSLADPAALVAQACGIVGARTVLADLGVLQTSLIGRAAADVAAGRSQATLVVGGEARRRAADRRRDGLEADESVQGDAVPDEHIRPAELVISRLEIDTGMVAAVEHYALIDSARSAAAGRSAAERRAEIDRLWLHHARGAADNPYAWEPDAEARLADEGWGRPLASPYHARHVTQWNVDQAAAVLVTSAANARAAGFDPAAIVEISTVIGSDLVVPVSERADIGRCPALSGIARAMNATAVPVAAVDHWDLYSCFPVAVELQAAELGLPTAPPSRTGGMTFGGGPYNNAALGALVRLAEVVQAEGGIAAVTALSGMATKQGVVVMAPLGAARGGIGARVVDVTEQAADATGRIEAVAPTAVVGPATVAAATVVFDREGPIRALAVLDVPAGRTLAASTDAASIDHVLAGVSVGAAARIGPDGAFVI
jgi:acetyl-CoA C-acetyltransferase